jgi:hypothetical protein
MNLNEEFKKNMFLIFLIGFILYYNIFINKDIKGIFFIIVTLIIAYIFYTKKIIMNEEKNNNLDKHINNLEKTIGNDFEILDNKIYYIHKTPRNLKYIKRTEDIKQIIYDLKFLKIYDNALYEKITSYLEYFLKLHYKIMLGKYDYELNFQILKDIRNEILNSMKTIYFNIPNISKILDIKNIDNYIEQRIIKIQSITGKYLNIVYHKYGKYHLALEAPYEYDKSRDKNYNIF